MSAEKSTAPPGTRVLHANQAYCLVVISGQRPAARPCFSGPVRAGSAKCLDQRLLAPRAFLGRERGLRGFAAASMTEKEIGMIRYDMPGDGRLAFTSFGNVGGMGG